MDEELKKTPPASPEAAVPEKTEPQTKKNKKINRLPLKELEKKLQEVQEKMGGLSSTYAQQLLKRKEQLLNEAKLNEKQLKE